MLEHVGLLRGPALWILSRRQPDQVELDGCTYRVHPRDFGVTLELHSTGEYESGTRQFLLTSLKPGMTFIDIGAHVGLFAIPAAKLVGPSGRVFAFEPNPSNRELLEANIAANGVENITVVPKAVSDCNDRMRLHCSPYNTGDHQLYYSGRGRRSVEVEVVRLDEFMEQHGGAVDLVKMDVQGAEARVLKGMHELMTANDGVVLVVELSPWMLRDIGDDPMAMLDDLVERGFVLGTMDESSGVLTPGSPDEVMQRCTDGSYLNVMVQRQGVSR
jgi:FkbM family methyltransferase